MCVCGGWWTTRLGERGGRKARIQNGLSRTAEESKLHSEECEAAGVIRLNFFSNFYGMTDITCLFLISLLNDVFAVTVLILLHLLSILNICKNCFCSCLCFIGFNTLFIQQLLYS